MGRVGVTPRRGAQVLVWLGIAAVVAGFAVIWGLSGALLSAGPLLVVAGLFLVDVDRTDQPTRGR